MVEVRVQMVPADLEYGLRLACVEYYFIHTCPELTFTHIPLNARTGRYERWIDSYVSISGRRQS